MWPFKKKNIKPMSNFAEPCNISDDNLETESREAFLKRRAEEWEREREAQLEWEKMNSYENKVEQYNLYVNRPFKYALGLDVQGWRVIETIKEVFDYRANIYHSYQDSYSVMHLASGRIEKVGAEFIDVLMKVPNKTEENK